MFHSDSPKYDVLFVFPILPRVYLYGNYIVDPDQLNTAMNASILGNKESNIFINTSFEDFEKRMLKKRLSHPNRIKIHILRGGFVGINSSPFRYHIHCLTLTIL